jgi:hypothetical protein
MLLPPYRFAPYAILLLLSVGHYKVWQWGGPQQHRASWKPVNWFGSQKDGTCTHVHSTVISHAYFLSLRKESRLKSSWFTRVIYHRKQWPSNNMEERVQDAHSKMEPAIYKRSYELEQAKRPNPCCKRIICNFMYLGNVLCIWLVFHRIGGRGSPINMMMFMTFPSGNYMLPSSTVKKK